MSTKMSSEEITRSAREIAAALRRYFVWLQGRPGEQPVKVSTNVGDFTHYGTARMSPTAEGPDGMIITTPKPHSMHLTVVSSVPTSMQKVAILDMLVMAIARELGAGSDAVVDRYDPVKDELHTQVRLARLAAKDGEVITDPYKTVDEPLVVSIMWPVAPGTQLGGPSQVLR